MAKKKSKVTKKSIVEAVEQYYKVDSKYKKINAERDKLSNFLKDNLPIDTERVYGQYTAKVSKSSRITLVTKDLKEHDIETYNKYTKESTVMALSVKPKPRPS